MKNTFKIIASFFVGGAIGGGVSYFLLKKKFDARIDAEVQSIKDLYSSKLEENKEVKTCENLNEIENSKNENNKKSEEKISENKSKALKSSIEKQEKQPPVDYANYYAGAKGSDAEAKKDNNVVQEVVVSEKKNTKKSNRVVISPDEFEDDDSYETIYLTYYADGILADEMDKPVKIENTVGKEALKHFGEYEDDMLHVLDDKVKIYYEVAKDNRKFSDISGDDSDDSDEED